MEEMVLRIWENLVDRVSGPMKFRLVLQPVMAAVFAIMGGLKDAKAGHPPYFWTLLKDPAHRRQNEMDGWKAIGKVYILALVLDVAYQLMVVHFVYVGEALIVAGMLALLPYLVLRGLVNRIVVAMRK